MRVLSFLPRLLLICLPLLLISCSDDDAPADPGTGNALFDRSNPTPGITDQEIWDAVYEGKRYPDGVYHEDLDHSLYYVNSISIKPLNEREDAWFELATEDSAQASAWALQSALYGGQYLQQTSSRVTEKFFEHARTDGNITILFRTHRAGYFDPSTVDLLQHGDFLGYFKLRPITSSNFGELIEYLWFIRNYQRGGAAILRSNVVSPSPTFTHEIIETEVIFGDWGIADIIRIHRRLYTVDSATGEVMRQSTQLEEFSGKTTELVIMR
ncbi:hypothetical protein KQI65_02120 [bacterium]|nr:hypothetical protein [bacterium]